MADRGRKLPPRHDAIGARELRLNVAIAPFALACFGFRALTLGQVEHESDTLFTLFVERCRTGQHWHAATALAEVFLLEGLNSPSHIYFFLGARSSVAPFCWCQISPAHPAGDEIRSVVSH